MDLSRRDLLIQSSILGAGLATGSASALWPSLAQAETAPDRFFLLIRVSPGYGGMDVTLGLDPWLDFKNKPLETDLFIGYSEDDLIRTDKMTLGLAAEPLRNFAPDICVLNGVFLSEFDNGHGAAANYMSTGDGQGKAPELPAEIAAIATSGPYGVMTNTNLYLGTRKVGYSRAADIVRSRFQEDPSNDGARRERREASSPWQRAIQGVIKSREITQTLKTQLSDLEKANGKLEDEHVAIACFLSGACRQAKLDLEISGLDTHSNHAATHHLVQKDVWTKVAAIFNAFQSVPYGTRGESLFDRTTFLVTNDFARTPALNGSKGKDHNPLTNSVLLAGAGIQTGKVINKSILIPAQRSPTSASYHMASPFNFLTGESASSRQGADFIYPQNLAMTVAHACGVPLDKFLSVPPGTKIIPGVVKS